MKAIIKYKLKVAIPALIASVIILIASVIVLFVDFGQYENVFGTFYQNCIGLTYFYPRTGVRGRMSNISIRNIYGKNAPRIPEYNKGDNSYYPFSFIWVDGDLDIDFLSIDNLCRKEDISDVETLKVCENAYIKMLSLSNILHQNVTDKPVTMFTNEGVIDKLYMYNVDAGCDEIFNNKGTVNCIKDDLI